MSIERKYASYLLNINGIIVYENTFFYFNILTWGKFAFTIINNL